MKNPALDPAYYYGPAPVAAIDEAPNAETEPVEFKVTPDADVSEYHVGGGWYEIPGHDEKIQGKDAAIAALAEG